MKLDDSPPTQLDKTPEIIITKSSSDNDLTNENAGTENVNGDAKGDDETTEGTIEGNDDQQTNKNMTDDDLGIYEDTDDGDDLTDTEAEIERLREEKRAREEEEKNFEHQIENIDTNTSDNPSGVFLTETNDNGAKSDRSERTDMDVTIDCQENKSDKLKTDVATVKPTHVSVQDWSAQRFLKGVSINDQQRKSGNRRKGATTSMTRELAESRNASRLALESREAMFRRAMSLLSTRCTSVKDTELDKPLPFGYQMPKYFYVTQEKPLPMEPLKAWRGYNGNVYFEPININPLNNSELLNELRAKTSVPRQQESDIKPVPRAMSEKENRPIAPTTANPGPESRSESRQTNKSSTSQRTSTRQMAILDKQAVLNRFNDSIHEDIVWLEGQENTGSLAVRPKTYPNNRSKEEERDIQYNKERIRKGSVVHKLYVENKTKQKPKLAVSGGKFTPPNSLSPLLRTQTQYSLSSHRLTTNSPDPYHHNDSKLPPLDQIRANLKHMDNKGELPLPRGKSYNRSLTLTDDMKPFVKYSPDVVAKFAQQTNSC